MTYVHRALSWAPELDSTVKGEYSYYIEREFLRQISQSGNLVSAGLCRNTRCLHELNRKL